MFHAELFSSSIASGANTFAQLNYFTPDNILPKLVNGMQISKDLPFLAFIAGVSANLVHVRAQTPSMLPFPYLSLSPNNRGTAFESPPRVYDFFNQPIPMRLTDEFDIFATQNAGAAQTPYVLCQFSNGQIDPIGVSINPPSLLSALTIPGRFFTVHWTTAVTQTAGQWSTVNPAFDQPLPAGYYALIGARVFAATALFFRMFPSYGPLWRPGGIAVQAYDQIDPPGQRATDFIGGITNTWGSWLRFYQNVPPQVEIFSTAADAAQEGWFDLVYLSTQTTLSA